MKFYRFYHYLFALGLGAALPAAVAEEASPLPGIISLSAGPRENASSMIGFGVSEVSPEDGFGSSLAFLADGTVLAGAPQAAIEGLSGKGVAYLFAREGRTTWMLRQKLTGIERNALEQLGTAVAAGDGFLAVSAPGERQIFIYKPEPNGSWSLQTRLVPQIGGKQFGGCLAADGDTLAVGDTTGVYLYRRDPDSEGGWRYIKRISLGGIANGPCHVALSRGNLLVGCLILRSTGGLDIGGAAIYAQDEGGKENWGLVKALSFPGARPGSLVGTAVALEGAQAAVGSQSGEAVYVFENGARGWELSAALTLARADYREVKFGAGLALGGGYLVAGAPAETVEKNDRQGAAYVFERNAGGDRNWGAVARWTSSEGREDDRFGNSVAVRDGRVAVGGLRKITQEPPLIYVRDLPPPGQADLRLAASSLATLEARLKPVAAESAPRPDLSLDEDVAPAPPARPGDAVSFSTTSSAVIPPPAEAGPGFGEAVSFSPEGAYLAVGEPTPEANGQPGKAHLYQQAADGNWKRIAILPPAKDQPSEVARAYGETIAQGSDGLMAIGGPGLAEIWQQLEPGSIKWARLKWEPGQALPPETRFGAALAVKNRLVAIGAPKGGTAGLVRIYRMDPATAKPVQLAELACPTEGAEAEFGSALAWTDAGLAIGAPRLLNKGRDQASDSRGAVYYYRLNSTATGLELRGELRAHERESTGTFGSQIALAGNVLVIGDPARGMLDMRRPGRVHAGQGAIAFYSRENADADHWKDAELLTSLLGAQNRGIGSRLALNDRADLLAVLAPSPENTALAAVHLFRLKESRSPGTRWVEAASFTSPKANEALNTDNQPFVKGGLALAPGQLAISLQAPGGQSAGIWLIGFPAE